MTLLIFAGLPLLQLKRKLLPLLSSDKVQTLYLLRNEPVDLPKTKVYSPPKWLRRPGAQECWKLGAACWICLRHSVQCVIGFYALPHGILAFALSKLFKKPLIQVTLGQDVLFLEKHRRLGSMLLKRAAWVGTRGSDSQNRLQSLLPAPLPFFIPQNHYLIPEVSGTSEQIPKTIDVLNVGRFSKVKRVDIFLKVLAELKKSLPNLKAVFVGGNPENNPYRELTLELGLENTVEFRPHTQDLEPWYRKSKTFLLTSESEGLPMVMVEAMSYGVPCVLPRVGDIPDLAIHEENALLANPLDVQDFCRQTLRLLTAPLLRENLSGKALETLRNKKIEFSMEGVRDVWEKAWDSLKLSGHN